MLGWFKKRLGLRSNASSAEEVLARGLALVKQGELLRAVDEFSEAIRLAPAFARPYNGRAAAYDALREYENAYADATQAIRLDPAYGIAYVTRASVLLWKGHFDRAIADYTEALRLEPNMAPDLYWHRGLMYLLKGERDSALADFGHASRLNSSISMPPPGVNYVELLKASGNSELLLHYDVLAQVKALADIRARNESDEANSPQWELIRKEPLESCEPPVVAASANEWHRQRWHLRRGATTLICEVNLGTTPDGTLIHIPIGRMIEDTHGGVRKV